MIGKKDSYSDLFSKFDNLRNLNFKMAGRALPGTIWDVCSEVYNPGTSGSIKPPNPIAFDIKFTSVHPMRHKMRFLGKEPSFWYEFICPPDSWVFLPHEGYVPSFWKDGKEHKVDRYSVIHNFGAAMFKGNRFASRPEAHKLRVSGFNP